VNNPLLAGKFVAVLLRCKRPVRLGNSKVVIFAGSSTAQFVKGSRKRAGGKKWLHAGNVRFSLLS
jgi:hypothetical protein